MRKRALKVARVVGIALLAFELVYLLAGNLLLWTGTISRILSQNPETMRMTYGRTYTIIPGRIQVSDFAARLQDPNTQFLLTVDHAQLDVNLFALVQRKFMVHRVRCDGMSFRFVHKVQDPQGMEARLDAYPPIPGFARPALAKASSESAPTQTDDRDQWTVRLDNIDAQLKELWILEHRWQGHGYAQGGFELERMHRLQVWPSLLDIDGGQLRAGRHVISEHLRFKVHLAMASCDVRQLPGMKIFQPITGTLDMEAKDFSPGVLDLYVPRLAATGRGDFLASLHMDSGQFAPGSRLDIRMERATIEKEGLVYEGAPAILASLAPSSASGGALPQVHVAAPGSLVVPVPEGGKAKVELHGLEGDLTLSSRDISKGISLRKLTARVKEGRVRDARAVTRAAAAKAPVIAPAVLGDGPLLLWGGIDHTASVDIVRLGSAQLGGAELHGAARTSNSGWEGAAAGHVGFIRLGLRLKNSQFALVLNVSDGWLTQELASAGIRFDEAVKAF